MCFTPNEGRKRALCVVGRRHALTNQGLHLHEQHSGQRQLLHVGCCMWSHHVPLISASPSYVQHSGVLNAAALSPGEGWAPQLRLQRPMQIDSAYLHIDYSSLTTFELDPMLSRPRKEKRQTAMQGPTLVLLDSGKSRFPLHKKYGNINAQR